MGSEMCIRDREIGDCYREVWDTTDEVCDVNESSDSKNLIDSMMQTQYFESLFIMNRIAEELNVSRKQKFSRNQMMLKKIPHTSVWVLLRSAGERNHMFYTLFWNTQEVEALDFRNVTPKVIYDDGWAMMSTDHEKLSHLLNCHLKWIALELMMQQTFESPVGMSSPQIRKHLNFMMMTFLKDKEVTSRNFQNICLLYTSPSPRDS